MVSGRKRHLMVDTLGMIFAVVVHAADIQDRDGARLVLAKIKGCFPRLTKILADAIYNGGIAAGAMQFGGWGVEGVAKPEREKGGPVKGMKRRWVLERSVPWLGRDARLWKGRAT